MRALIALLALSISATPAAAAAAAPLNLDAGASDKVALSLPADVTLLSLGFAGFVIPELLKGSIAPSHCNACNGADNTGLPGTGSQGSLNGVDAFFHDALTGSVLARKSADTVSNVYAFAALPTLAIAGALAFTGPAATDGSGLRATVIVLESTAVSAALIQSVKFFAARKRPFVRYGHGTDGPDPETGKTYDVNDRDSHISFPSGHTALATALGVSLAMTATLEDSKASPWLWCGAAVAAISTGALRMIAEKHYFTDVAAGALIGAASGVVIPLLHRRGSALGGQVSVSTQQVSIAFAL